MKSRIEEEKVHWQDVIGILSFFIILPPFIGVPFVIMKVWMNKKCQKTDYFVLAFCVASFLAAVNATKTPSGDQYQYFCAYNNVPIHGLWYSLVNIYGYQYEWEEIRTSISGEFMNGVYNYIGYYITFGYYPLFEFFYTLVSYTLLFTGLYKFCSTFEKPRIPIICGILTIGFFYLYFQYTLQIQKQFFAQAIMMFVIGDYSKNGKLFFRDWVALFCSVFTHQSMFFFVPFIVLKRFRKRMDKLAMLFVLVVLGLLIYWGPKLLGGENDVSSSNALTYGMSRFANSETHNDTTENALVLSQVLVIALPIGFICWKKTMSYRKVFVASQSFLIILVSLLLVTVFVMFKQPTAQYRFFMMLIAFMPFVYPMAFDNLRRRDKILEYIAIIMIAWFFFQFSRIIWTYAPEIDIIVKSPILLVFSNYQAF